MSYSPIPSTVKRMALSELAQGPRPASTAMALSQLVHIGVVLVILMPTGAMGFAGVYAREPIAAAQIFSQGDRFQMPGVDTTAISAQMINRQPFGNRTNTEGIGNPVCIFLRVFAPIKVLEVSVPIRHSEGSPRPTGSHATSRIYLGPKSRLPRRYRIGVHTSIVVTRQGEVKCI